MKKLLLSLSLLLSTAAYSVETDHTQIQKTLEELQASIAKMTDKVEHVNTKSDLLQKGIETTTGYLTQALTQLTQILDNIANLKQNNSEQKETPKTEIEVTAPAPVVTPVNTPELPAMSTPTEQNQIVESTPLSKTETAVTAAAPAPETTPVNTPELPATPTPIEQNQVITSTPLPMAETSLEMMQQQFTQEQSEEAQVQQETTDEEQQPIEEQPEEVIDEEPMVL
jgi:uncharacterized protein YoxC